MALYEATDGDNWTNKTNWLSDEPLGEWYGVDTNANGRVTRLNLESNALSGALPSSLGDLTNLIELRLNAGRVSGPIPPELGNLTNLEELFLDQNQLLSGPIPPELGNLTNLQVLSLWDNQLSGPIPSELGNLTNLRQLALSDNQLSGTIPLWLGDLTNLIGLWLGGNQLSGPIPSELGNLTNLIWLALSDSQFSGSLPESLVNLTNLQDLNLRNTQLCAPRDAAFQRWLEGIEIKQGVVDCPEVNDDRPTEEGDRAQLAEMRREIDALIGDAVGESIEDCGYVGLGSKPCGGPWEYIVYSASSTDSTALVERLAEYNAFEDEMNARYMYISDCSVPNEPVLVYRDGRCLAEYGGWFSFEQFTVGEAVHLTLPEAQDGTPPYTYSVSDLPAGLSFDPETRTISGTPTVAGEYEMTYRMEDASGNSYLLTVIVIVEPSGG